MDSIVGFDLSGWATMFFDLGFACGSFGEQLGDDFGVFVGIAWGLLLTKDSPNIDETRKERFSAIPVGPQKSAAGR